MTNVLLTGASSFTGCWLADALVRLGATVVAPLNASREAGDGLRQQRLDKISGRVHIAPSAPFGSENFMACVEHFGPFDLVILHGAEVGSFRDRSFSVEQAVALNTHNLEHVVDRLAATGCRRIVVTGTVFEADEGAGDMPLDAIGDDGVAKTLTWHRIRHVVRNRQMALGKFVIPHPIGALEKPGLTSHLIQSWINDERPVVQNPRSVRDFIHADLLAEACARFALALPTASGVFRRSPGGYRESVEAFAHRLATVMRPRLGRDCLFDIAQPERSYDIPEARFNTDVTTGLENDWDYAKSWNLLANFYNKKPNSVGNNVIRLSINS